MNMAKLRNKVYKSPGAKLWDQFKFKCDQYVKGQLKYNSKYGLKGDTLTRTIGSLLKSRTRKLLDWYHDALEK